MIIVEIQAYGDFDVPYTHAIVKSENHTKDSLQGLMKKYSELMKLKPHEARDVNSIVPHLKITSSGISGISNFHNCRPDDLVVFLISEGFSFVKTSKIILSD